MAFEVWVFVDPLACWCVPAELPGFVWEYCCPCWLVGVVGGDEFDSFAAIFSVTKCFRIGSCFLRWSLEEHHYANPKRMGLTHVGKKSICESQIIANWKKKCAHDYFTLEVWMLGRKGSWECPVKCFKRCIASRRRWILLFWGMNKKSGSCHKRILTSFFSKVDTKWPLRKCFLYSTSNQWNTIASEQKWATVLNKWINRWIQPQMKYLKRLTALIDNENIL